MTATPEDRGEEVEAYLRGEEAEGRLKVVARSSGLWDLLLPSYWKESIAASLELRQRSLHAEAFFMRAPEDNAASAYKLLLQRNSQNRIWRFGTNEDGDVSLVADLPVQCLGEEELDQLFGALVSVTDDTYRPYFELAYSTALDNQVARGGPGLDQPPPWAKQFGSPLA